MFQSAIVFALLLKSIAASKCSTSDAEGPIEIPINFVLNPDYTPVRLAGKIVISDGCSFSVSNLKLINAGITKFYGGNNGSTDAITLSMDNITHSQGGGSQNFKFRSDAGAEASFKDFKQFRIFDETYRVLLGTAAVPVSLTRPPPPPTIRPAPASSIPTPTKGTTASNGTTPTGALNSRASAPAKTAAVPVSLTRPPPPPTIRPAPASSIPTPTKGTTASNGTTPTGALNSRASAPAKTAAVPVSLTRPPPPTIQPASAPSIPTPTKGTTASNGTTPTGALIGHSSHDRSMLSLGLVLGCMFLF